MRVSSVNTGNELSKERIKKLKAERCVLYEGACDLLSSYCMYVHWCKRFGAELPCGRRDWRPVPTVFGISLLLGAYVMALAYEKGCKRAELLAVRDDDTQHSILRRHYRRLGLEVVKEVNNDIDCFFGNVHSIQMYSIFTTNLPMNATHGVVATFVASVTSPPCESNHPLA